MNDNKQTKPDHWYSQSGVIPYRITKRGLEILLITSIKKKKWIIPKGIIDPGLSAAESAVKEAEEEAGVRGSVNPVEIGEYNYRKWGGICYVKVFAFAVEEVLENWIEADLRERKWFEIDEAIKVIDDKALKMFLGNSKGRLPHYK